MTGRCRGCCPASASNMPRLGAAPGSAAGPGLRLDAFHRRRCRPLPRAATPPPSPSCAGRWRNCAARWRRCAGGWSRWKQLLARQQAAQPAPAPPRRRASAPPRAAAPASAAPPPSPPSPRGRARAEAAAREARAAAEQAQAAQRQVAAAAPAALQTTVPGLEPPEPMGAQDATGDALRSDLPGIAFRVPGTDTQVRLYGFAKLTAWQDFDGRNQTDAPLPGGIPLNGSAADQQGGDFGMTARFSRFGVDTRTPDLLGHAGDPARRRFRRRRRDLLQRRVPAAPGLGGDSATSGLRVLVGQANSLWNEGLYETLIDATNLNQSFVRQAQIRVTGRLAPGLTGQVSIEAPDTQYTSAAGVFTPGSSLDGGASPAFNAAPDLLGRLT